MVLLTLDCDTWMPQASILVIETSSFKTALTSPAPRATISLELGVVHVVPDVVVPPSQFVRLGNIRIHDDLALADGWQSTAWQQTRGTMRLVEKTILIFN